MSRFTSDLSFVIDTQSKCHLTIDCDSAIPELKLSIIDDGPSSRMIPPSITATMSRDDCFYLSQLLTRCLKRFDEIQISKDKNYQEELTALKKKYNK